MDRAHENDPIPQVPPRRRRRRRGVLSERAYSVTVGIFAAAVVLNAVGTVLLIFKAHHQDLRIDRVTRREVQLERPTQAQLIAGILHALAVCHVSPRCAAALVEARRGISPRTGRRARPSPNAPGLPSANSPTTTQTTQTLTTPAVLPGPGQSQAPHPRRPPPMPAPPSGGSPPPPGGSPPPPTLPVPVPLPVPLPGLPLPRPVCALVGPLCHP